MVKPTEPTPDSPLAKALWNAFAEALKVCALHGEAQKIWSDESHQRFRNYITSGQRRKIENLRDVVECLGNHDAARIRFMKSLKESQLDVSWAQLRRGLHSATKIEQVIPKPARVTPETLKLVISYSTENRAWAGQLAKHFTNWKCGVTLLEQGPELKMTRELMREAIEDADCLLVLMSREIFEQEGWTRRHVDWAKSLHNHRKSEANRYPMILAVTHFEQQQEMKGLENLIMNLHGFHCGKPNGKTHDFGDTEHLLFKPETPTDIVKNILEMFQLDACHIKSRQDLMLHDDLFQGAMRIYERLIPDDCERDPADFIARWIASYDEESPVSGHDRENWVDWLTVMHRDRSPYGAFWANVDRREGLGAITFWGMKAGQRSNRLSAQLVKESLGGIADYVQSLSSKIEMRAMFFDVEPVDLAIFDEVVAGAFAEWKKFRRRELKEGESQFDLVKKDIHPESGKTYLQTYLQEFVADEENAEALAEQVRRCRRLLLYTSFEGRSTSIQEQGWSVKAFVRSDNDRPESDSVFATYIQPPIIPSEDGGSVRDEDSREFCMFAIVAKDGTLAGEDALRWQYDSFLADQYSPGKETELDGWSDYMVDFKAKNMSRLANARLKAPRLGKRFAAAKHITGLITQISRGGGSDPLSQLDITL